MSDRVRDVFDMVCPSCEDDEHIAIFVHTWAPLSPDGTDANDAEHLWDGDDDCTCRGCGHVGKVADFVSIAV